MPSSKSSKRALLIADACPSQSDFLEAQNDRQLGLASRTGEIVEAPFPTQCDPVEEFQGTEVLPRGEGSGGKAANHRRRDESVAGSGQG